MSSRCPDLRLRFRRAILLAVCLPACSAGVASASPVATSVTKLEPRMGPVAGGTQVKVYGSGFTAVTAVEFGRRQAESFEVRSPTEILAVSPPWTKGNAIAEVTVSTMAATSGLSGGDSFIYEPVVTRIEPSSGPAAGGTSVTIAGEAFEGLFENGAGEMPPFVESVNFGSAKAASFKVESESTILAVSPPGTGTADVTVTTFGGTSATSSADRFLYLGSLPAGPPAIDGESVSGVTSTDATLEAQIDTQGLETAYQFVLATAPACEEAEPPCLPPKHLYRLPRGELLGSFAVQGVSLDLNSADVALSPGERYEYRVVATNAAGEAQGARETFVAQESQGGTAPGGGSGAGLQAGLTTTASKGGFSGVRVQYHKPRHPHRRKRRHHRGHHHRHRHHGA